MRTIKAAAVTAAVRKLCIEANLILPPDLREGLWQALKNETFPGARDTLNILLENAAIAEREGVPICQDTGMACVFLELGQEVHIADGSLYAAVNEGVRRGYAEGYLRSSVVSDPLRRENSGDNTPALIHTDIVPGDSLTVTVAPKGFGSENMSRIAMLKPSDGVEGVKRFVIETVEIAGANPCPPAVVGVGIGGSFDGAALLAKRALLRPISAHNRDEYYAELEGELLSEINRLGIGPGGFGGRISALGVNIEAGPTHIAGLPVAVNMSCHATRRATAVL